jgi:hypothetical protein
MMGHVNKTDKLDANGLAKLRTALKNRMHSTLATPVLPAGHRDGVAGGAREYGITSTEHSDIFVGAGRAWLKAALSRLPPETGRCVARNSTLSTDCSCRSLSSKSASGNELL